MTIQILNLIIKIKENIEKYSIKIQIEIIFMIVKVIMMMKVFLIMMNQIMNKMFLISKMPLDYKFITISHKKKLVIFKDYLFLKHKIKANPYQNKF